MNREKLVVEFKWKIESANDKLKAFKERFDKDPMEAFSWSSESIQASTDKKIFGAIMNSLEKDTATVEDIKGFILDKVLHKAKFPNHSTSAVSNIVSECEMVSWSEAYEAFQRRV